MIFELRIYTLWPGKVPEFLKLADERAVKIRGDDYGKMEGYWFTEIGPLNQIFHLWSYDNLNTRQELRAKLGQNEAWRQEYASQVQPLIRQQHIRLMHPVLPFKPPGGSGNVYEYRNYRLKVGKAVEWLGHFKDIMPTREKYSPNVGVWHTEAGEPNEISHLWVYPDFATRMEKRGQVQQDPAWHEFLAKAGGNLEEMNSTLLIPAPFSPIQ